MINIIYCLRKAPIINENEKPTFSNSSDLNSAFDKLRIRGGLVWSVGLTVEATYRKFIVGNRKENQKKWALIFFMAKALKLSPDKVTCPIFRMVN